MNPRRTACALTLVALTLAACASRSDEPQPPEIAYGLDVCEACGMIIGDARFAAATLTTENRAHKFDDIGDMVLYHMQHPEEQVRAWFVHDYATESWMRAEAAVYVMGPETDSPMGHGVVAFADPAQAEAFASDHGAQTFEFDQMRLEVHVRAHG